MQSCNKKIRIEGKMEKVAKVLKSKLNEAGLFMDGDDVVRVAGQRYSSLEDFVLQDIDADKDWNTFLLVTQSPNFTQMAIEKVKQMYSSPTSGLY